MPFLNQGPLACQLPVFFEASKTYNQVTLNCRFGLVVGVFLLTLCFDQIENLKSINGKCLTKQCAEKKHQRHVQTLSGTFMAISRQIHGTSWHFPHVIFTSLSYHFSWHFDGNPKNMAPNTFMPFSRRFHGTCPQNFKIIIIQYIMFMSLSCHFHGFFFNLKDKPYSCQIHVTLMACSKTSRLS